MVKETTRPGLAGRRRHTLEPSPAGRQAPAGRGFPEGPSAGQNLHYVCVLGDSAGDSPAKRNLLFSLLKMLRKWLLAVSLQGKSANLECKFGAQGSFVSVLPSAAAGLGEPDRARPRVRGAGDSASGGGSREPRAGSDSHGLSFVSPPPRTPSPPAGAGTAPGGTEPHLTPRAGFAGVGVPGVT